MNRQINNPAVDGSPDLTFYQKKDNVCHTLLKVIKMYCCDCDKSIYANRQKESINTIDSGLTIRKQNIQRRQHCGLIIYEFEKRETAIAI